MREIGLKKINIGLHVMYSIFFRF